jgi:signal peptidase I
MVKRTQLQGKLHQKHRILQWCFGAILTALLVVFLFTGWFSPISMANQSMYSTLNTGDVLLYNRLAKFSRPPQRGEMIVFQHPFTKEYLIKRVIALDGETVRIESGSVIINDKYQLDESGYCLQTDFNMSEREVPEGAVFVLSDNRVYEDDSRNSRIGFIYLENILGTVQIRVKKFTFFFTKQVKIKTSDTH